MLKKAISILLTCGLFITSNLTAQVLAQTTNQTVKIRQMKNQTEKFDFSSKFNVGTSERLKATFTKGGDETATDKLFTAADAEKLEKRALNQNAKRNNFSTAAKVGIGIGVALAVALVVFLATRNDDSDESGTIRCGNIQAPCP